jgi:uncharacterized protein YkwD
MSVESELIRQVNLLRKDPAGFASKINASKTYFVNGGNIWKHPDAKAGIKTEEGPAAYEEAIRFLRSARPVPELTPSKGLSRIAGDFLVQYQSDANANVEMDSIIDKYGKFTGNFRRLIEFGGINAEQSIINLVVSDGDKSRGHREALLADNLNVIGVAHGTHDVYRNCSVIVAATQFENTYDSNDRY